MSTPSLPLSQREGWSRGEEHYVEGVDRPGDKIERESNLDVVRVGWGVYEEKETIQKS